MGIYFDQNNKMVFDCRDGGKVMNSNCGYFIVDVEGNVYEVVQIGDQYWMMSNLKTNKYADGSLIPNINNYNDWFLASKDELNAVYTNLVKGKDVNNVDYDPITDITQGQYWTSSEYGSSWAWTQYLFTNPDWNGEQTYENKSNNGYRFAACRSFTSTDSYSLRDIGPAGGWIFHITGTTYYEFSPSAIGYGAWSNITASACGATGTTIGTGASNTATIIAQGGHTSSAAQSCNDVTSNTLWADTYIGAYCGYNNTNIYKDCMEFDGIDNVVTFPDAGGHPSIAGSKTIKFDLFLRKETGFTGQGVLYFRNPSDNQDNFTVYLGAPTETGVWGSRMLVYANGSGTTAKYLSITGLSLQTLHVTVVKTTGNISSVDINGVNMPLTAVGKGGYSTPDSYIGCTATASYLLQDATVWNVEVVGYNKWLGTPNGNTDAAWVDQIGSVNGTVSGSPTLFINDVSTYGNLYNWYSVNKKYDDWFLPSRDEIDKMRTELYDYGVGDIGVTTPYYWCSTEDTGGNPTWAYVMYFNLGYTAVQTKDTPEGVRACRKFTSNNTYNLRDFGPAGGYIFYITGSTYYEASPEDLSTAHVWSNITGTTVGTASIIGTGQTNTTAIINQSGHTDSAAKLCADYETTLKLPFFKHNGYPESGWRVPVESDFTTLATQLGGASVAGGAMKQTGTTYWNSPNSGATNSSGFNAIGGGYRDASDGTFTYQKDYALLLSSDEQNSTDGVHWNLSKDNAIFQDNSSGKSGGFSVRCVKDTLSGITIGTQTWSARNIDDKIVGSMVYNKSELNRPIYGGLYSYNMIPQIQSLYTGWHVPTMAEWVTLYNYLGGGTTGGGHLKESGTAHWTTPNGDADNSSGFTALPGGQYQYDFGGFSGIHDFAIFLTSTQYDASDVEHADLRYTDGTLLQAGHASKSTGLFSVRLIKD